MRELGHQTSTFMRELGHQTSTFMRELEYRITYVEYKTGHHPASYASENHTCIELVEAIPLVEDEGDVNGL